METSEFTARNPFKSFTSTHPDGNSDKRYLLQVDVVQVVAGVHRLHHPGLGSVEVQREERRLRHVQKLGQGAEGEAAVSLEHHLGLQHVAVEAGRNKRTLITGEGVLKS